MGDEASTESAETTETEAIVIEEESGFLENDPLDALFPEETAVEEKVIEKEETVVTTSEADETGKEKKEVVPTKAEEKKVEKDSDWKMQAYLSEKGKRQDLEARLNKLENSQKPVEKAEFDWKDPDKTLSTMKSELRQESKTAFLNMSQAQCMGRHEDFGEKYTVFKAMIQANPAIAQTMLSQPDPAQYAYDLAKQKMFQDEVGADPVEYKAKLEAQIRADIEKENTTKAEKKAKDIDGLPPSVVSMTDKVPINGVQKEPFEELFPGEIAS